MIPTPPNSIRELFEAGKPIDDALRRGIQQALLRHKRLGQSIVVFENGKTIHLSGDQIPDPEPDAVKPGQS